MKRKEDFFTEVSLAANGIPQDAVKHVFYAMLKVFSRRLKASGEAVMPDWGKFRLKMMKEKKRRYLGYEEEITLPPRLGVRFKPDHKVVKYFHEYGDRLRKNTG